MSIFLNGSKPMMSSIILSTMLILVAGTSNATAATEVTTATTGLDDHLVGVNFPPLLQVREAPAPILNPDIVPDNLNLINQNQGAFPRKNPLELHKFIPPAKNTGLAWKIYKTSWDATDERGYQAFVTAIGRSECFTLDICLRDEANPYRDLKNDTIFLGDCADMAYVLRAYYAWKNGLPYSYQYQMRTADGSAQDLRYSTSGNKVTARRSTVTPANGNPINGERFIRRIGGEVSTAMFRTHPVTGVEKTFDDFYPVTLTRQFVVPGSIAYDVFGHVGIVYEVEDDGRVLIVASHPDNSVTRSAYGPNFLRTGPNFGGGLKAWRPIWLDGARQQQDGTFKGGKVKATKNENLLGFSLVQYNGNIPHPSGDWALGEFRFQDRTLGYYDFVRFSLALPDYAFSPVRELRNNMQAICGDLKARKVAVDQATRDKVHFKKHPSALPPNIYGTYGTWEAYSTPSRDARLKTGFAELRRMTEDLVTRHTYGKLGVNYQGDNIAGDLLNAFEEEKLKCKVTYRRMDNTYVILNMAHVMERLFDLSFDPYHCPERRWGAKGNELSTCQETPNKKAWYKAEQFLRNQVQRTYDVSMNFRLDELKSPLAASPEEGGIGTLMPPDINVKEFLVPLVKAHQIEKTNTISMFLNPPQITSTEDTETTRTE